jgi:hypothetical protein
MDQVHDVAKLFFSNLEYGVPDDDFTVRYGYLEDLQNGKKSAVIIVSNSKGQCIKPEDWTDEMRIFALKIIH